VAGSVVNVAPMKLDGKLALNTLMASPFGLPPFRLRAALSAAPSTAFDSCALTM
jgi:hypothetical protein